MDEQSLPELPRPAHIKVHTDSQGFEYWEEPFFNADQMHEYLLADRAARGVRASDPPASDKGAL